MAKHCAVLDKGGTRWFLSHHREWAEKKTTTLCFSKWSNIMVLINTPYNNNNSHKGNNNIAIYGRVICAFTSSATTKSYYIFFLAFLTSFLMAKAKSQCCMKSLGKIACITLFAACRLCNKVRVKFWNKNNTNLWLNFAHHTTAKWSWIGPGCSEKSL